MENQIEAERLLASGNVFYEQGNYKDAIAVYDEVVNRFGGSAESAVMELVASALNNKGFALGRLNQDKDAIAVYDEVVNRFGESAEPAVLEQVAWALYNKGNALSGQKRYDEAIEQYKKATDVDADNAYAHHNIAHYLSWQGKYKEGLESWNNARKSYENTLPKARDSKNADNFLYYGSVLHEVFHELDEAEKIYEEGLSLDPNHIGILIGLVKLYLEKKDVVGNESTTAYWKARKNYRKAEDILKDPLRQVEDARTSLQLGKLYLTMEDYTKAKTHLSKALEKDKESAEIYANLGIVYTREEDFKKAVGYFENARRRDPDDLTVWSNLAEAYLKSKQVEKAEAECKKILRITPYHVESHIGLGEVYTVIGEKDEDMYNEAIRHFTEAINLRDSENASKRVKGKELAAVYYSRGYARVKYFEASKIMGEKGLLHDALTDFTESFDKDPDHHKAERAKEKLKKRLSRFSRQGLTEKIGPFVLSALSFVVFTFTQCSFFFSIPNKPVKSIDVGYYALLTFGSLIFMVAGLYLPQILKLKFAGIELEKSSVEQITTSAALGISKS